METLNIELSVNEVNQVLQSLGSQPFVQVVELIQKIKTQAETQVAQANKPPAE